MDYHATLEHRAPFTGEQRHRPGLDRTLAIGEIDRIGGNELVALEKCRCGLQFPCEPSVPPDRQAIIERQLFFFGMKDA
jgi:hypothetical protein